MVIGVHSVCTAVRNYYEIVCYLASGDEINCYNDQNMKIDVWTAMPSKKRIPSYFSQHGDKGGCSLNLYCKFEMIL